MDKIMELLKKVLEALQGLVAKLGLGDILDKVTGFIKF